MGFFGHFAKFFTRTGRDDNRLQRAMAHAHAKHPEQAIPIYDDLLNSQGTSALVRARALFNRALAHSAMKDDQRALADLEEVVVMEGAPENVVTAARTQLIRVRNRVERVRVRAEQSARLDC